jgi:hypothetical protein
MNIFGKQAETLNSSKSRQNFSADERGTLVKGRITIEESDAPIIRAALIAKVVNKGGDNSRADGIINSILETEADCKVIEICYEYMNEIFETLLSSNVKEWLWVSPKYAPLEKLTKDLMIIAKICGCYITDNCIFADQDHNAFLN